MTVTRSFHARDVTFPTKSLSQALVANLFPDSVAGKNESGKYVIVYIRSGFGWIMGAEKAQNILSIIVQPSD